MCAGASDSDVEIVEHKQHKQHKQEVVDVEALAPGMVGLAWRGRARLTLTGSTTEASGRCSPCLTATSIRTLSLRSH